MKLWNERRTWIAKDARDRLARLNREDIRHIAVIKHAAFGDLLLTRPFLITLRKAFPGAEITFSAINHYQRGIPHDLIDHLHVSPSSKDKVGLWETLKNMRQLGEHDLLFDLTENTRSMWLSLLNKASFKIGFQHRGLHRYIYDAAILRAEYRFEAETFLEQLHLLGIQYTLPLRFDMPVDKMQRSRPYVVYFPTASNLEKSWPPERFIELIGDMAKQYPALDHILLAGLAPWERDVAKKINAGLTDCSNFESVAAGKDDPALVKGAELLVSNDTGIRHLGIALGTPTLGIFFDTPPFGYWPRYGRHEVVYELDGGIPGTDQVSQAMHRTLHQDME